MSALEKLDASECVLSATGIDRRISARSGRSVLSSNQLSAISLSYQSHWVQTNMDSWLFLIGMIALIPFELFLSKRFNKFYFERGLPLFVTSVNVRRDFVAPVTAGELEAAMPSSSFPGFVFNEIDDSRFGFREALFGGGFLSYTPMMHGVLQFDAQVGKVIVRGLANWFPLAFIGYFLFALNGGEIEYFFGIPLAIIVLAIYTIQFVRFSGVASAAARWRPPARPSAMASSS